MPYLPKSDRPTVKVAPAVKPYELPRLPDEGSLNYALTRVAETYRAEHGDSYATFNAIVGAMEAAKLEFYRRVVAPYEDFKRAENGDVYAQTRFPV